MMKRQVDLILNGTFLWSEDVKDDKFDPSKFLYYEQGNAATAVMNYCNALARINAGG